MLFRSNFKRQVCPLASEQGDGSSHCCLRRAAFPGTLSEPASGGIGLGAGWARVATMDLAVPRRIEGSLIDGIASPSRLGLLPSPHGDPCTRGAMGVGVKSVISGGPPHVCRKRNALVVRVGTAFVLRVCSAYPWVP